MYINNKSNMSNQLQSSFQYPTPIIINMEEIINNPNIDSIYCNYFLTIPFKLIGNTHQLPKTLNYAINYLSNLNVFIECMREKIKNDFTLSTDFDVIINTQKETGIDIYEFIKQLYPNRNLENMAVCEIMGKTTGFYIRPKQDSISQQESQQESIQINDIEFRLDTQPQPTLSFVNINDCPVCFASLEHIRTNFFQCRHHICYSCFTNWRNRNGDDSTCPLCRSRLNYI